MHKNYINDKNNKIYVAHFPGSGIKLGQSIIDENINRSISIDSRISIITPTTRECGLTSGLIKELEYNSINYINTAENETVWLNTKKIKYILESLEKVRTEYALILDGRDTIILNDLDEEFIEKFKSLKFDIIYNATTVQFPRNLVIEPLKQLMKIPYPRKYLNAGVCFGKVDSLKKMYNTCEEILLNTKNKTLEQPIVRMARQKHLDICGIDHECDLFVATHDHDTKFINIDENTVMIK